MSDEDRALLQAVQAWRPPTTLHPIAKEAYVIYERHEFDLPDEAVQALRAALDTYAGDVIKLAEAVEGMTRFMILLDEHRKDEVNAKKVLLLLREYAQRFEPFWRRVAEALENEGSEVQSAFQRMTGVLEERLAVKIDEPPPEGTIPLSTLLEPTRPPPWARKKKGSK